MTRTWNDYTRQAILEDYVPDCDLGNFAANGECGAIGNNNFGKNNPNATRWDPDVLNGYGKRDANWDFSTEIQHELRPGFAVTGGYYYNNGGYTRQAGSRKRVTDNLLVAPADYDTYCIKAPTRMQAAGRRRLRCVRQREHQTGQFGRVQNFVTVAGAVRRIREPQRLLQRRGRCPAGAGHPPRRRRRHRPFRGQTTASSSTAPGELVNCRVVTPFQGQTHNKAHGVFPLPAGFVTSFAYQNLSGPTYNATYVASGGRDRSSRSARPLSGGADDGGHPARRAPDAVRRPHHAARPPALPCRSRSRKFRLQLNLEPITP